MTKSEYQELAEFMAQRFDSMDERLSRVEILGEDTRHKIQIVAEGVTGNSQRIDAFRAEVSAEFQRVSAQFQGVAAEFRDVRQLIQVPHGDLDRRVTTLEHRSES